MNDRDCVSFLQETLPRLRLRWNGFRRVRGQVCKRLQRRLDTLQLRDLATYRQYLARHPAEWDTLDACCRITISRFYRDHRIFNRLEREALPPLVAQSHRRGETRIRAWSAGCGAGEEPYTLAILWAHSTEPALRQSGLDIHATDSDAAQLRRARLACYPYSSIRGLPPDWRDAAFSHAGDHWCLLPACRQAVRFRQQDIRIAAPAGPFDLVLCRNLAFTYFDKPLQLETGRRIAATLCDGGLLVLGAHERLPEDMQGFAPWHDSLPFYRRQENHGVG